MRCHALSAAFKGLGIRMCSCIEYGLPCFADYRIRSRVSSVRHFLAPLVLNHFVNMGLPFFNNHARKRDQVVAIDLGGRTTKAVHLQRRGEKFNLINYALVDSPIFDKCLSPDLLADHMKNVVRALGGRAKQVTLALGVNETIFRQVDAPLMPIADLRLMLKFNSKTYLQQELPDHVFDCQYVAFAVNGKNGDGTKAGNSAAKQKVMVGGAKKQTLDDVQAAFKIAGLIADNVVPGIVGPVNAFEMAEPEAFNKEVVALVELGFKNSTITILDSGEIMLNRVVAIGGDRVTHGLAEALNVSYQEAENIKVGMPDEVVGNLEPLIHPLGRELRASVDFFENHHDKTVGKVFVSGGPARSELIVQALQAEMMVPCQVWAPTKFLQLVLPPEKIGEIEHVAPQLSVAIGAATASF
jgi:type IV pilus assembly protein PilM